MTKDLALTLLNRGNNGNEILQILDAVVSQFEDANIQDFVEYAVALNTQTPVESDEVADNDQDYIEF